MPLYTLSLPVPLALTLAGIVECCKIDVKCRAAFKLSKCTSDPSITTLDLVITKIPPKVNYHD